jgi:hypothetical protein
MAIKVRGTEWPRILFARVGRMRNYAGPVPGDEKPVGGGRFTVDNIGGEAYNFLDFNGQLFGFFQPSMQSQQVALERIDGGAVDVDSLDHVLIVFVARRKTGGQVVVGWYRDANLRRESTRRSPGKPRGFGYLCSAKTENCILLPEWSRTHELPSGKGGMGQSNVCYPLNADGTPKNNAWMKAAIDFITDYQASDLLSEPEADAERESAAAAEAALARSKGQGFARDVTQRRAIENRAMALAKRHFRKEGFEVEDVSTRRSYDLLCRKGKSEIHVEVKGTTTDGSAIVLTHGEVEHACGGESSCALFILHSIELNGKKAIGGRSIIVNPWELDRKNLRAISYTYRIG